MSLFETDLFANTILRSFKPKIKHNPNLRLSFNGKKCRTDKRKYVTKILFPDAHS